MKHAVFVAGMIGALLMVNVAAADPLTLNFTTGGAGTSVGIFLASSTSASGNHLAIGSLIVSGDGLYDGTYHVIGIGALDPGDHDLGVGVLKFDESASTITIVGGVTCAGLAAPTPACSQTDIDNATVLVPLGTTLMKGTGAFTDVFNTEQSVHFSAPDVKDASLLAILGIAPNLWALSDVELLHGTGNQFPVTSSSVLNTHLPEPTSVLLLGTILLGVTSLVRRRTRKA